jgi:hypothetical protein
VAVSVSFAVTPPNPEPGAQVTATYTVTGNSPVPGAPIEITGSATVGGVAYDVTATAVPQPEPALPVTYSVPVAPGLTFTAGSVPGVFTAVIPS